MCAPVSSWHPVQRAAVRFAAGFTVSPSVATSPANTVTALPASSSLAEPAVELSAAPALLVIPVAVRAAVSPTFAFAHCFFNCSVVDLRVFV